MDQSPPTAHSTIVVSELQHNKEPVEKPSKVKRNIKIAWQGIEQLLLRSEKFLDGTPFKTPVAVLNTVIGIANARYFLPICFDLSSNFALGCCR